VAFSTNRGEEGVIRTIPRLVLFALALASCGSLRGQSATAASAAPTSTDALTPSPQAVQWRVANGVTACGVVRAYVPATAGTAGSLRIGSRTFAIAPGTAAAGSNGFPPSADKAMCVWGGLDGSAAAQPNADPIGPYRCGRIRSYVGATSSGPGRLRMLEYWTDGEAEFIVPPGTPIGTLHYDDYRCFALTVDGAGDAYVTRRDETQADVDLACGHVAAYSAATAASPGFIRIGAKSFTIPAGVTYRRDPAGAPVDPIALGQVTCFNALLDDTGAIARYGPVPVFGSRGASGLIGGGMCGRVVAFKAPTSSADGSVALSLNGVVLPIPSGSQLTPLASGYYRCFDLSLDSAGNMIAVGDKDQPLVGF
jgi:hypothetical protein